MIYHIYLKDRKYYEDLYDEATVFQCRLTEKYFTEKYPNADKIVFKISDKSEEKGTKTITPSEVEKLPKKGQEFCATHYATRLRLLIETGERYLGREKRITENMERDRLRDEKRKEIWDSSFPKENKRCRECGAKMLLRRKDIFDDNDHNDRVCFTYECSDCKYREAEYADGEIWEIKPNKCPKCDVFLTEEMKKLKTKTVFICKCPHCEYADKWEIAKKKKKTLAQIKEENLLERDKLRFCLTEKEGVEYAKFKDGLERVGDLYEKICKDKEEKPLRDKAKQVKKLNILGVQKRIKEAIKGKKFQKLKFGEANTERHVTFKFTTYEANPERLENTAKKELKKVISDALKDTNWKLTSEGIDCRMGILSGKIRGLESEEEIIKNMKTSEEI